jgi:WD40 repeat protein
VSVRKVFLLTCLPLVACLCLTLIAIWPKTVTFQGHTGRVHHVASTLDGKTLASASVDKTIKLWDVVACKELATLNGHTSEVCSLAFSPDSKTLASADYQDKTVTLWEVPTGTELATFQADTDRIAFSPDGKILASTNDDRVTLWDVAASKEQAILVGHTGGVNCVAFSPDGKTLASGSCDNTITLWDIATGKEGRTLKGHSTYVRCVAFSPDGKTLASGDFAMVVKLWDVGTGKERVSLHHDHDRDDSVWEVAFSPDGTTLASLRYCDTLKLWHVASGKSRWLFGTFGAEGVRSVLFTPEGKLLALGNDGSDDRVVKMLEVITGKETWGYSLVCVLTPAVCCLAGRALFLLRRTQNRSSEQGAKQCPVAA